MSEYKPPEHPWIYVVGDIVYLSSDGVHAVAMKADDARKVGLILMETGLHLKSIAKKNPLPGGKNEH